MSDYNDYMEYYKKTWEQNLAENKREIDQLKEENARLREALESISGIYNYEDEPSEWYAGNIAREALKGEK